MLRQFDVSTGDVGLFLGLAFFIGGIPGPVLGGYITAWATKRDERWRALVPGLSSLLCVIPLAVSLTSDGFWVFLAWFAFAYAIFVASQAGILSGIQSAVEPSQRGFAVATALFFNNLVGQMLGLAVIGAVSDWLQPSYGNYSLSIAVFAVCVVSGVAAMAVFAWTAWQMGRSAYLERMSEDQFEYAQSETWVDRQSPAIDQQFRARHEGALIACKEGDGGSCLGRIA